MNRRRTRDRRGSVFQRTQVRLTIGYVGVLAGIILVFGTVVVLGFWQQVQTRQDTFLFETAQHMSDSEPRSNPDDVTLDDYQPQVCWLVVASDGSIGSRAVTTGATLGLPDIASATEALQEGTPRATTVEGREENIRVVSIPVQQGGRIVAVVQAGQSTEQVHETVERLLLVLIPIGGGALALAAIGGLFVSRRAMRPVQDSFERQRAFVADASHELKTPLTLIRADAEVLARGHMGEGDRELVEDLLDETDRMSGVLSDLLLLARLDAGKLAVAQEAFDLTSVLDDAVERFSARAVARGLHFKVEGSEGLTALGDAARTEQILAVILDNALRYTPAGGAISVSVAPANGEAMVVVRDEGPGIAPDHLPHIFDRFYRAEEARTREGGGAGLGLAIARDLARAQNGDLTAGNAEGGGAIFRLVLPRSREGSSSLRQRGKAPFSGTA